MKHHAFTFLSISLVGFFFACNSSQNKNPENQFRKPISTIIRDKDGNEKEEQEKFETWYEGMHRAAPGVNWKQMDAETRQQKYFSNTTTRNSNPNTVQEVLANGNLIGQWNERGSANNAGRVMSADLDTATGEVYCGTDGGNVWRGNMNGSSWTVLNDKLKFSSTFVRVIPHNSGHRVIVSGGTFVHYTDDEGQNWYSSTGLSVLQSWGWIKRSIILNDSLSTMYLLVYEWDYTNWNGLTSIYKSTDHAVSFSRLVSYPEPVFGSVDYFDVWAPRYGTSDVAFIHNDSSFTLNRTTDAISFLSTIPISSNGNTLLAGYKDPTNFILYLYVDQIIYKSIDGGQSWNNAINTALSPYWNTGYSCSCANPNILYLGDIECHVSNDSGNTWNTINAWWAYYAFPATQLHGDIPSVTSLLDAQGNEFQFICTDGGLYVSHDNLQNVQNISLSGLNISQYYSVYTNHNDYNYIYAGAQDQGFQRTQVDSGNVLGFTQIYSGDYGHIGSQNGGTSIWMNYPGFTDYYANGLSGGPTADWDFSTIAITTPFWIPPLTVDRDISTRAYLAGGSLAGTGGHIIQEDVSGSTITPTELPYDFNAASGGGNISAFETSPLNHDYWYVLCDNGKFFRSTDAGITWTMSNVPGLGAHYWYGATIYPSATTLGLVFCGGSGYSNPPAYRSNNNGMTFAGITNGLPSTLIFDLTGNYNDSLIFAATEVGPYVYVMSENKWYDIEGVGAPDQTYWEVEYVAATNTARFATYGRGIWDFAITSPSTVFENNFENSISVFPNPAKDNFSVNIHSTIAENATLTIYDLHGNKIQSQAVNLYNGENHFPVSCATFARGIYLVEINSQNKKFTEKIVITN